MFRWIVGWIWILIDKWICIRTEGWIWININIEERYSIYIHIVHGLFVDYEQNGHPVHGLFVDYEQNEHPVHGLFVDYEQNEHLLQ